MGKEKKQQELIAREHEKLGPALWRVADALRGQMDADAFKDYILGFLFLRYLSDVFLTSAEELLRNEEGRSAWQEWAHARIAQQGLAEQACSFYAWWYPQREDKVQKYFKEAMIGRLNYFLSPCHLWPTLHEVAQGRMGAGELPGLQHDDGSPRTLLDLVTSTLEEVQEGPEGKGTGRLNGVFGSLALDSPKLGSSLDDRNTMVSRIVRSLEAGLQGIDFSTSGDSLGDAYEYLIGEFASSSGRKAGEFYTPQDVSTVLSRIVTYAPEPSEAPRKRSGLWVLDFACGSGSLLLNVYRHTKHHDGGNRISCLVGQERNFTTYNLARMNLVLHGVKLDNMRPELGDSLAMKNDYLRPEGGEPRRFDMVVANPPFSLKWEPESGLEHDPRFAQYGLPPRGAADWAFVLHGLYHLKDDGTMAVIVPHGALFREGVERGIRCKLLEQNVLDAVIALPDKLFYSTGIPVCVLVMRRCRREDYVRFIDASRGYVKVTKQNRLRAQDVEHIVTAWAQREDADGKPLEEEGYSRNVPRKELLEAEGNLSVGRYIGATNAVQPVDVNAVLRDIAQLEADRARETAELYRILADLGFKMPPSV